MEWVFYIVSMVVRGQYSRGVEDTPRSVSKTGARARNLGGGGQIEPIMVNVGENSSRGNTARGIL